VVEEVLQVQRRDLEIPVVMVVLVVELLTIPLLVEQHQEIHSQELLEQLQHQDGDILVVRQQVPDKWLEVAAVLVELEHKDHLQLLVVLVFKFHQHLEILHS